jgi:hypothetical protein
MASIIDILGYRNISESIVKVETGIPDRLPPAFTSVKEEVTGDTTTWVTFRGQRQLARRGEYGSPSRSRTLRPIGEQSAKCLHFPEHIFIRPELHQRLRNPNDLLVQKLVREELARHGADHRQLFDNTRVASITMMLSKGKIWFDSDGAVLPSSSGADLTVDYAVPAGNRDQVSGIIDQGWDDPDAPIIQHITDIDVRNKQATGRNIKHAFYGKNIARYLFQNNTLKAYWQFNPKMYESFSATPGAVPQGFAGLQWHFMGDVFFDDATETTQAYWDDDQVTFTPEIDRNVYTLFEGSTTAPVYGAPAIAGDLLGAVTNFQEVFGMGGYCVPQVDPVGLKYVMFDTFFPAWKNENDMTIVDTVF